MDLETFFTVGTAAPTSAQNTFTNRTAELDAFADSLAAQALDDPAGEIFARCVHRDIEGARRVREHLTATRSDRAFGFWVAITGWWLSELSTHDEPDNGAPVDWLYGKEAARARWVSVLTNS